MLKYRLVEKL